MAQEPQKNPALSDPTPSVSADTDLAPLGRSGTKPPHELTADEDVDVVDWERVAAMDAFSALVSAKRRFIVPAVLFFIIYYFALPVSVGYAPGLMGRKVFGVVNLAYLFALSQFLMAWLLAALYMRAAGRFDEMAEAIKKAVGRGATS